MKKQRKTKRPQRRQQEEKPFDKEAWQPKTELGRKVKAGEITNIDQILDKGHKILESEIIDILLPNLEVELLNFGQSKGKFGGGKSSIWRQTQKKTREGNKPKFSALVAVGNRDGYVGLGRGKARETVPAREKAIRRAKLNITKIPRGCGSWECGCGTQHSIPIKITGKVSGVEITIMPAPKGSQLRTHEECKKILELAGIKDVHSKARGKTSTRINVIQSCFEALKKLNSMKVQPEFKKWSGMQENE